MGVNQFIIYLLCFSSLFCFSQTEKEMEHNLYITDFKNKVSTRLFASNTSNAFMFTQNNERIELTPNKKAYLGLSILFRSIELDLGFSPEFLAVNKDNEGSELTSFNFRIFLGQWIQSLDLYNQKGFTTRYNHEDLYLKNINSLKIGGTTAYNFNKNFSYRAVSFQNEWQTKSTGSFIPGLTYYYTHYQLKLPETNEDAYNYSIAISPAYYYNFVIHKNILLSLGGTVGTGINYSKNLGADKKTSALFLAKSNAVLGYNSTTFFGGINSNLSVIQSKIDDNIRQDDAINYIEFYVGYRFDAPKSFIKLAEAVNTTFGF